MGRTLIGYSSTGYTPIRTINFDTDSTDLVKIINFARTIVADFSAGRTFSDYVITNGTPLKNLNNATNTADTLAKALAVLMTVANELGATRTTSSKTARAFAKVSAVLVALFRFLRGVPFVIT